MAVEDSFAQDQLTAFIDRILRMKEEADAIASDIKEIYAEAKANGFDKTQLGNVVSYLRKKEKDGDKLAEGEAVFDLYLDAYMSTKNRPASRTHAYARAKAVEITEPQPSPKAGQAWEDAASSCGDAGDQLVHSSVENEAAEISTPIQPEAATSFADAAAHSVEANDHDSNAVASVPATQDGNANTGGENVVRIAGRDVPETDTPAGRVEGRIENDFDRETTSGPEAKRAIISREEGIKRLRPHCQQPGSCRSSGGKAHCNTCLKAAGQSLVSA